MTLARHAAGFVCGGDCDRNSEVTVNELITMVNVALGETDPSICVAGDSDGTGEITVNEIVAGVHNALNGCAPSVGRGVCGDQVVDSDKGEECDDGGVCIGGTNAGVPCAADSDCHGQGVCDAFGVPGGGERKACSSDADCDGAACVHCKPFGGDGCAANCTDETAVVFTLKRGEVANGDIRIATSGAVVHGDSLTILLPLSGTQTFLIGKPRDGRIPVTQQPAFIQFPPIAVGSLGCACVRGVIFKTCGGTVKEVDGVTDSTDCRTDADLCAGKKPCTAVAGPGNSGEGTIACTGLSGINFSITQDAGGTGGTASPAILSPEPGSGGPGSALITAGASIGTIIKRCTGNTPDYGPDGQFCTADDPETVRGTATLQPLTTGMACATLRNANGRNGNDMGPFCNTGVPLSCGELASGTTAGAALASAFPALDQPSVGDIVVSGVFVAQ
jgi:hypothetical protein